MKNITIAGNCTKDAELRDAGSNKVAGFSVAVNGFAGGEKTTTFFDVSVWGKRGEAVLQFAKRGAKICVTGDLGTREYNGKTYLTVNASDFTPMGGGQQSQDSGQHNQSSGYNAGGRPGGDIEDDIPFNPEMRA